MAVEGPSKAEITCQDNKDGTCTVSYLPTAPGDYNIIVRFDDKHIPGSPFTAKITGEMGPPGSQRSHHSHRDACVAMGTHVWSWEHLHGHGDTYMAMGTPVSSWP